MQNVTNTAINCDDAWMRVSLDRTLIDESTLLLILCCRFYFLHGPSHVIDVFARSILSTEW